MRRHRTHDDTGSLTVELVALTPVLFFVALVVLVFGRVSEARQQVVESARAGAQFAAVLPDATQAQSGARSTVATATPGGGHLCPAPQVITDVSHFFPGGYVSVTVICHVALGDLSVPGLPGSVTIRATSTAPIDPYRSVQ